MTTENAIELENATRTFDGTAAVDELSLSVRRGELYGFLGPNGAGKSTTIGLLMNYLGPTNGHVRVFDHDAQSAELEVKARTGVLPEGFTPYPGLTGREHVRFVCSVRGDDTAPEHYLDRVGLLEAADQNAGGYSSGMTRRLGLAMALVDAPDLLVLDEPFAGLDPGGAMALRDLIREEPERGTTVFFSSHQLAHVGELCDRVGIIDDGDLVVRASLTDREDASACRLSVALEPTPSAVPDAIETVDGVTETHLEESTLTVSCSRDAARETLGAVFALPFGMSTIELERGLLEDLYAVAVGQ